MQLTHISERLIAQGIIQPEKEVRRRGVRLPAVKKEEAVSDSEDALASVEEDEWDSDAGDDDEGEDSEEEIDCGSGGLEIIKHTKPKPDIQLPVREGVRKSPRKRGANDLAAKKEVGVQFPNTDNSC
jgi:hypothetical protein